MSSIQKLLLIGLLAAGVSTGLAARSHAATPRITTVNDQLRDALTEPKLITGKKPVIIAADTFKEVADLVKSMVSGSIRTRVSNVSAAASTAF